MYTYTYIAFYLSFFFKCVNNGLLFIVMYHCSDARGLIVGLTAFNNKSHIVRAGQIAFNTYIHTYNSEYHTRIHNFLLYIHSYIHTNIHTYIHTYIHCFKAKLKRKIFVHIHDLMNVRTVYMYVCSGFYVCIWFLSIFFFVVVKSALEAAAFQTLDVVEAMQRDIAGTNRLPTPCMYVCMYVCMYMYGICMLYIRYMYMYVIIHTCSVYT